MTIEALQTRVDELKVKVAAKAAELKDGLPEADQKRIEAEHDVLVADYEAAKERLADAEFEAEEDESAEETRVAPVLDADEVRRITAEAAKTERKAERKRVADIIAIAEQAGFRAIGDKCVSDGSSLEEARVALFDALAEKSKKDRAVNGGVTVDVSSENAEKRGLAMQIALLHRDNPDEVSKDFDANPLAREYRGLSLLEMARENLEQKGISTRSMSKMDLAAEALCQRMPGQGVNFRGGMMSTSDFPNILANVLNKTLRAGYVAAGQTFRPLVREVTVSDFKQVQRTQLGEAPQFSLVNEHGEFTRGSVSEAAEKYSIATYGKVIAVTRQVLINDDLNAFTRIPRSFGVSAANLESDLVWAQILSNPTLNSDNVALFHATHANLTASGANPIAIASVSAARLAMAKQTGLDGKTVLNIKPVTLIVPMTQQTVAEQFYATIYPASSSAAVPESMRQFAVISDPRLDLGIASQGVAGNAFSWYLAASINQIDLIELAYLEGNRGVYTETQMGFNVDGLDIKVRLDVGAKVIDFRGLYKVISTS